MAGTFQVNQTGYKYSNSPFANGSYFNFATQGGCNTPISYGTNSIYGYGFNGGCDYNGGNYGCCNTPIYNTDLTGAQYANYAGDSYMYGGAYGYYDPMCAPGFDRDRFRENMNDTQQFYTQYNNQQIHNQRAVEMGTNAAMEDIKHAALVVKDKVDQNEQEQIIPAFLALKDAVRRAYQNDESGVELTEDEIQARALTHYQEATGQDLIKDIRENGHSSFMSGLINSVSFGLFSDNCPEDTVADITGQEAGKEEKTMNRLGKVTGGVGTGAAIGAGIGSVVPGIGTVVGGIVGGVVGGIIGLFT